MTASKMPAILCHYEHKLIRLMYTPTVICGIYLLIHIRISMMVELNCRRIFVMDME